LSLFQSLVLADISGTRLSASLAPAVNVPGSNFYTCIGQLAFDPQ
jgi:hypothetical protein